MIDLVSPEEAALLGEPLQPLCSLLFIFRASSRGTEVNYTQFNIFESLSVFSLLCPFSPPVPPRFSFMLPLLWSLHQAFGTGGISSSLSPLPPFPAIVIRYIRLPCLFTPLRFPGLQLYFWNFLTETLRTFRFTPLPPAHSFFHTPRVIFLVSPLRSLRHLFPSLERSGS